MEMKRERLTLIEMERKLLSDTDGSYRKKILKQLEEYQQFITSHISIGLDTHRYEVFNKLKLALESAKNTIINFK